MIGTIIKYHRADGFGFAVSAEDPILPDIFVHFTMIRPSPFWSRKFLLAGMKIEFVAEPDPSPDDPDRLKARDVRVIAPVVVAGQTSAPGPDPVRRDWQASPLLQGGPKNGGRS